MFIIKFLRFGIIEKIIEINTNNISKQCNESCYKQMKKNTINRDQISNP